MTGTFEQYLENRIGVPAGPLINILQAEGGVIAGGAVRDYLRGAQCNDLDIFFPTKGAQERAAMSTWATIGKNWIKTGDIKYGVSGMLGNCPTQFLHHWAFNPTNPVDLLSEFDFTCNAVAWLPNGQIVGTTAAQLDAQRQIIHVLRVKESSLDRIFSLMARGFTFPDYAFYLTQLQVALNLDDKSSVLLQRPSSKE